MKSSHFFLTVTISIALIVNTCHSTSYVGSGNDLTCNTFDDNGKCIKCSFRYFMDSKTGLCTKISDNCKTWKQSNGKCLTCYPGYGSPVNGVCGNTPSQVPTDDTVDPNCKCHNDNRICVSCYSGWQLDGSYYCVQLTGEDDQDHCISYGYVDTKGKFYSKWSNGCKAICKACEDGYYLDQNSECQALPNNCQQVDDYGYCTECQNGYQFDEYYNCVQIVQSSEDHCVDYGYVNPKGKWYSYWVSGCQKVCNQCESGYYLDYEYECSELPPNCDQADQYGVCTNCSNGYKLNSANNCVSVSTGGDDDHCIKYGYINAKGTIYLKWNTGCNRICRTCADGYYLDYKHRCVALPTGCDNADQNGTCLDCSDGYTFNSKNICVIVNTQNPGDHCASYKYTDSKGYWYSKWLVGCKKVCDTCDPNYELNGNGNCVLCKSVDLGSDPYCVTTNVNGGCDVCAFRTVKDYNGRCKNVSDQCRQWDNTGCCTSCYGGYKLSGGDCVIA